MKSTSGDRDRLYCPLCLSIVRLRIDEGPTSEMDARWCSGCGELLLIMLHDEMYRISSTEALLEDSRSMLAHLAGGGAWADFDSIAIAELGMNLEALK